MKKIMMTASALVFCTALAGGAMAAGEYGSESPHQSSQSQMQMDQSGMQQTTALMSSDKIIGKKVQDDQGQKLGEIKALLVDADSGQVGYAVVGDHPVPWKALRTDAQTDTFTLSMSPEQFKQAPKGKTISSRDEEQQINQFYGVSPYWEGGASQPQLLEESPSGMEPEREHGGSMMEPEKESGGSSE